MVSSGGSGVLGGTAAKHAVRRVRGAAVVHRQVGRTGRADMAELAGRPAERSKNVDRHRLGLQPVTSRRPQNQNVTYQDEAEADEMTACPATCLQGWTSPQTARQYAERGST